MQNLLGILAEGVLITSENEIKYINDSLLSLLQLNNIIRSDRHIDDSDITFSFNISNPFETPLNTKVIYIYIYNID